MGFEKVPTHGRSVSFSNHHMGMHFVLAFIERDVADQ